MLPIILENRYFTIYSYPLFFGIAFGLGWNFLREFQLKKLISFNLHLFFIGTLLFSILFAKIFFLIFSAPDLAEKLIFRSQFWFGGGLVFYGGLIGALFFISSLVLSKRCHWEELKYLVPVLAVCHSVGRIGCFLAGCCFGKETKVPWSVLIGSHFCHPVQLYEAIFLISLALFLFKKVLAWNTSKVFGIYLVTYSLFRFCIEYWRDDTIRGHIGFLSVSQFISIVLIPFGILLFFFGNKWKKS